MESFFVGYPFLFGLFAALLHVLSGPDHLAAIGPLALNSKLRAWLIGFAWAMGHITGMLIIGTLFFFFKDLIPVEFISQQSEKLVGFMLILIGLWAFYRLWKLHHETEHEHQHLHTDKTGNVFFHKHRHQHTTHQNHQHPHSEKQNQSYWAALGIGTIHGLAGVSHLLGVLPTLAYTTTTGSVLYLSGFSLGTILAMVLFSVTLGIIGKFTVEHKKKMIFKLINGVAGLSAIFVGLFWILHN